MTTRAFPAIAGESTANPVLSPARQACTIPTVTVIAHPDPDRIGARVGLVELAAGRAVALSRTTPGFVQPGSMDAAPLSDQHLSRTPIWLVAGPSGSVQLERRDSAMRVVIDGTPLGEHRAVPAEQIEEGAVILVGDRVALVLHQGPEVLDGSGARHGLIGESEALRRLRRGIHQVAAVNAPVLLRGESGTGKELVARAVHEASPRRAGPYVAVNMAAIPPALAAAELFGASRGAFTGADQDRPGYFSRAHGGTLFLDEIGEAATEVQALLLRALETGEVQAVGGLEPRRVDVRVIAATDADLQGLTVLDLFRVPLLHRLMASYLQVPPLRARREDFGRLLYAFLREEFAAVGKRGQLRAAGPADRPWLPAAVVAQLATLPWPGNVRQLRNCARALVVAARDAPEATLDDIADLLASASSSHGPRTAAPAATAPANPARRQAYRSATEVTEDELLAALRNNRWRLTPTAADLRIARTSLYALIERCPRVRKAKDLVLAEIERELARAGGDADAAACALGVSRHGLLLRLRELRVRTAARET